MRRFRWLAPDGAPPPKQAAAISLSDTTVDETIASEMRRRHIPGLSLAIIQDGKIVKAQGYGTTEQGGQTPVTARRSFRPVRSASRCRLWEHCGWWNRASSLWMKT